MAIAFGAEAENPSPATTATTHAATITAVTGDLLVILISNRDSEAGATSVVGSLNGAFTRAGAVQGSATLSASAEIWYFENSADGSETVTATFGTSIRATVNLSRWTGAATSSALDQNNGNENASGTAHHHGSITTTGSGLIVITFSASGDPGTGWPPTGFTALTVTGYTRGKHAYRIVTGATTDDGDFTSGNTVASVGKIASFNEAAAGGGEVSATPMQRSNRGFGPAAGARIGGQLQRRWVKFGRLFTPSYAF